MAPDECTSTRAKTVPRMVDEPEIGVGCEFYLSRCHNDFSAPNAAWVLGHRSPSKTMTVHIRDPFALLLFLTLLVLFGEILLVRWLT